MPHQAYLPERVTLKLDPGFIIIIISYKTVICFLLSDKYFHSQVFEVESYTYRYRELGQCLHGPDYVNEKFFFFGHGVQQGAIQSTGYK